MEEYIDTLHPATTVGVIAIDLDHFKVVNDTEGHAAGDLVLRTVADRILGSARRADHAARTGGDEFVVLCCAPSSEVDLKNMADRLVESIGKPIGVGGVDMRVSASVGVAIGPVSELSGLHLRADAASYQAKRSGGAVVAVSVDD